MSKMRFIKTITQYLDGDGDNIEDAMYEWAKEFASAGVRKGKNIDKDKKTGNSRTANVDGMSYYAG